jgi:hypothetical protein
MSVFIDLHTTTRIWRSQRGSREGRGRLPWRLWSPWSQLVPPEFWVGMQKVAELHSKPTKRQSTLCYHLPTLQATNPTSTSLSASPTRTTSAIMTIEDA